MLAYKSWELPYQEISLSPWRKGNNLPMDFFFFILPLWQDILLTGYMYILVVRWYYMTPS
jgi:hypothetical protein